MPTLRQLSPAQRLARILAAAIALGSSGCQQVRIVSEDDGPSGDGDGNEVPEPATWSGPLPETDGPDPGDGDGDGDGDGEPGKLDLPPELPEAPCSVVDLLFVIDNSNSMIAEQTNLIASFDGFIAGIQTYLDEANDYHIGVVTTDAYALNDEPCQQLGALVTRSAAGSCGPWTNGRFISLADELDTAFTCAADVGGDGNGDEHQAEAALLAISPAMAEPGACNEGFIRDDALLVLVIITDEDDGAIFGQGSPGDPSDWVDDIVARKGVESNVVVLVLAGVQPPNACDNDVPFEGAQLAQRLRQFVQAFTYGRLGDVCADDYAPFFEASLEIIHDACVNFMPEG